MTMPKWAVTVAISATVAVVLIVLHFFGLIGPAPQPVWPFEPEPQPYEFFRVAQGFISGVFWTASTLTLTQIAQDMLGGILKPFAKELTDRLVAWLMSWFPRP